MQEELLIFFWMAKQAPGREVSAAYAEHMSYDSYLNVPCYPVQSLQQTITVIHCGEASNTFRYVLYFLHPVKDIDNGNHTILRQKQIKLRPRSTGTFNSKSSHNFLLFETLLRNILCLSHVNFKPQWYWL